jgi:ferric-dicitrate binding protein FerR (iron transport regulator)
MEKGRNSGQYARFTLSDFIADPFFQDWVIHPEGEAAMFWDDWVPRHPEKAEMIREARMLLESVGFEEQLPTEEEVQQSLARAREIIAAGSGRIVELPSDRQRGRIRRIGWAAAVIAGIGIATVIGYLSKGHYPAERSYATPYGELRTVYLPDSSRLVLNAHSSVRYAGNWRPGQAREVWLDGEGYFDVRPDKASTFLVHTKDLTVEVLGTTFDIRNRRGKTEVVLETGRIRVQFPAGIHGDLVLAPGDRIIYDPDKTELAHTVTVAENYTSWKDKKLMEPTVGEILDYLEDNYHKTFILEDPTLADKKIGGVILLDNLNDALFALSTVLNVNIIQQKDTIILKKR